MNDRLMNEERERVERKHGIDEVVKLDGVDPKRPYYHKAQELPLNQYGYISNPCSEIPMPKRININEYKLRLQYDNNIDTLTYRKDELGNILYKKWDSDYINKQPEDKNMPYTGEIVVYVNGGNTDTISRYKTKDIWEVVSQGRDGNITVRSLSSAKRHEFTTKTHNLKSIEEIYDKGYFKKEYFNPEAYKIAYADFMHGKRHKPAFGKETSKNEQSTEDTTMKNDNLVKRTTNANVDAAKVAATITAGKTLNGLVAAKVTPQLPLLVRGYADTAIGRVVLANIADFAVKQFMANNTKANVATEAMMQAAMLELADSFDLEGIVTELVDSVAIEVPEAE